MSNTNTKEGSPARGRIIFAGGMAHATLVMTSDWEMPVVVSSSPSWAELNRGKRSKRERRK